MRCTTTSGPFRCDLPLGHPGECATDNGPRARVYAGPPGGQRIVELEARVVKLETALTEIRDTTCHKDPSCICCLHDRGIATEALRP